ncbi:hypothetical protein SRHO_G00048910 [Serrasalmus rhombeus]
MTPQEYNLLYAIYALDAKPIYGGWLLLAPEGTNFDNPLHRSRVSHTAFTARTVSAEACSEFDHGSLSCSSDSSGTLWKVLPGVCTGTRVRVKAGVGDFVETGKCKLTFCGKNSHLPPPALLPKPLPPNTRTHTAYEATHNSQK